MKKTYKDSKGLLATITENKDGMYSLVTTGEAGKAKKVFYSLRSAQSFLRAFAAKEGRELV